jgi:exonuclease VII small subunit
VSIEDPGYEEAWAELATIRAALEDGRVGIGSLATTLARAGHLVAVCRRHLRAGTVAVEEFVSGVADASRDDVQGT